MFKINSYLFNLVPELVWQLFQYDEIKRESGGKSWTVPACAG